MGAAELGADASAAEPGDRFAVKSLGGLALAQQRSPARLGPKRPVGATGARDLREPLEGVCRVLGVAGADGRLDELDETEVVERQILWIRAGPLGRAQRVLVASKAVAQQCARPFRSRHRVSLAPIERLVHRRLDQRGGLCFSPRRPARSSAP
jgi:hypothetical protein